jgi:hypothetical protein
MLRGFFIKHKTFSLSLSLSFVLDEYFIILFQTLNTLHLAFFFSLLLACLLARLLLSLSF